MISFSAEQNSTMPAHLSIIQHLLFRLFKLAERRGWGGVGLAHSQGVESRKGGAGGVLRGPVIHFSFLCCVIRSAVTDSGEREMDAFGRDLNRTGTPSPPKSHFSKKEGGEKGEIDNIFSPIMHRQQSEI